jgi:hypothetical protein
MVATESDRGHEVSWSLPKSLALWAYHPCQGHVQPSVHEHGQGPSAVPGPVAKLQWNLFVCSCVPFQFIHLWSGDAYISMAMCGKCGCRCEASLTIVGPPDGIEEGSDRLGAESLRRTN